MTSLSGANTVLLTQVQNTTHGTQWQVFVPGGGTNLSRATPTRNCKQAHNNSPPDRLLLMQGQTNLTMPSHIFQALMEDFPEEKQKTPVHREMPFVPGESTVRVAGDGCADVGGDGGTPPTTPPMSPMSEAALDMMY